MFELLKWQAVKRSSSIKVPFFQLNLTHGAGCTAVLVTVGKWLVRGLLVDYRPVLSRVSSCAICICLQNDKSSIGEGWPWVAPEAPTNPFSSCFCSEKMGLSSFRKPRGCPENQTKWDCTSRKRGWALCCSDGHQSCDVKRGTVHGWGLSRAHLTLGWSSVGGIRFPTVPYFVVLNGEVNLWCWFL